MNYNGFDISSNNGSIDWSKVAKQSEDFVMVRASYGKVSKDSRFKSNVAGAQSAHLQVGAYHYSYAASVADAQAEAKNFLAAVGGLKLTYPLVYDLEYNSTTAKSTGLWTDMAIAFLSALEKAGYFAMLYSDKNSLINRFDPKRLTPYAVWVAQWAGANTYPYPYGIWQKSATGSVAGITGNVDIDVSYHDYAAIIKNAGLNHL